MRHPHLLLAVALLAIGCPTRDEDPAGAAGSTGTPGTAGAGFDGGVGGRGGAGGVQPTPTTVMITSPTLTVYTNAIVSIAISTSEPTTNTVTLVATGPSGSETIGTITAPLSSLSWNTSGVGEGSYSVTAQLTNGSATTTSNAVTVVVDRTPPQVVLSSLVPASGAANVVLVAPIQASFSEPVLASTVTATAIPIQTASGATVPTTVALSADGETATVQVTSDQGISLDQTFSGSFTKAITDLAGNPLVPPSAAWSWEVPGWVKYAPIPSIINATLLLAVGTSHQPVVAYNTCETASGGGCIPLLHVAVSDGEAWSDLGQVTAGVSANYCALFLDSENNPTVAWGNAPSSGAAQIVFSTWNGSTWGTTYPAIDLTAAQGQGVDSIAVAIDGMGHPVVGYRGDVYTPTTSTNIYVTAWTGTAWDDSYGAVGDTKSSAVDLLLGAAGSPIVTVVDSDTSSGAYLWNGTSWSLAGGASAISGSGTVDSAGSPVVLSILSNSNWVPEHLTAGTWLPLVSGPIPASAGSNNPTLASDANGEPVVAWSSPTPTGIGLVRWTGTTWDTRPGVASGGSTPNNSSPRLTVDGRNDMWIGWTEEATVYVWMSNY